MGKENAFLKQLEELKELGALQGGFVTEEQLGEIFPDFNESQAGLLRDYLLDNHIGIGEPVDAAQYLTDEENGYLKFYLEELDGMEEADADKKRILVINSLNGDTVSRKKLTESYLKAVVDIAKLYAGQGVPVSDLIGEGNVALAIAVDMLDCIETPEDAEPMIIKAVMNSMEEFIGAENEQSRKSEKALETVEKVTNKAKEMAEELLRKVTVEELSKESGISQRRIREAMVISKECLDYIESGDAG